MDKPIRVLHVEDDPADRERVRRVLSLVGGFEVTEATRAKEFERLLAEGEWDCVLTDIQLSGYTGLDVLDRVNAMQLGIPVVFLAGGGSEEVAVEAMKRGAADYILKVSTHYVKLPLVLRNAVSANRSREARARTQKALEQSEAAYRQLFQANPHPMWVYDVATLSFLEVNDAAVRTYGWTREEFLGLTLRDIRPAEDVPKLMRFLEENPGAVAEGSLWRHLRKNGDILYVETSSHPIDWSGRRAKVVLVNNVTERVQVEDEMRETLAELNTLHQAAPVGIALVSNRTVLRGNHALSTLTGYSREDLMLLPAEKLFASPEDAARFYDVAEPQLSSCAAQFSLEQQIQCRDGSRRPVRITGRCIDPEQPWKGEVWVVEDLEQARRADAALGRLAEDLAEAQRVGHLGSWSRNFLTGEVVYSAEQYRLLGLDPAAPPPVTAEDFVYLLHPEDREAMAQAYRRLRESGEPTDVEFRVPLPDGGARWVHASMRAERDASGRVVRAYGINQDVTVVRIAQEQVLKSRDFYMSLLENFPVLTWHTDADSRCRFVNRGWTEFTGLAREAAYGSAWQERIHPDDRARVAGVTGSAHAERKAFSHDYRLLHADGTYHWVRDVGGPVYDLAGEFSGFVGSVLDLEDRRRAEEALRASESRMKQVLEMMPVMLDAFDEQGNIIMWNRECERVSGYSAAEIVGNPRAMELLYPDAQYRERMLGEWKARGDQYRDWEWTLMAKDGTPRQVMWSNLSREQPIEGWATWGTGVDITSRRRAESLLEESEKRFRIIMDAAGDGIFIADTDGRILDFNTAACESLGYSCEELLRMHVRDIDPRAAKLSPEEFRQFHLDAIDQTVLWDGVHVRKDGTTFPVQVRISGVEFAGKRYTVGIARNVEQQLRFERALRESEERFRALIEESPDFIAIMDHGALLKFVSPSVSTLLGYDPRSVLGRSTFEFVHPADVALAQATFAELLPRVGDLRRLKLRILAADGSIREVDVVARNLFDVPAVGGVLVCARELAGRTAT
jgi:PAS domain S-box-containing protein